MCQPKTPAQYLGLVDQAIFEVEDLLRCAQDEEGGIAEFASQMPSTRSCWRDSRPCAQPWPPASMPLASSRIYRLCPWCASGVHAYLALLGPLNTAHKEGF